jgi:competence protein ComEC
MHPMPFTIPARRRRKFPAGGWLFLLVGLAAVARSAAADTGRLTVTWLDMPVHGLAVVMETPSGGVFLIDTGGTKSPAKPGEPGYDAGRDTIAPFLTARGHTEIAALLLSHPHGDHFGGAPWLLEHWKVRAFVDNGYTGRGQTDGYLKIRTTAQQTAGIYLLERAAAARAGELRAAARQQGGNYRAVVAGDRLDWDPAISVEVLSPPAEFLGTAADPAKVSEHGLLNQNSIVLRVQHGKNVFLFPGDCYGGSFEQHLKATVTPERLKTTVLTAPHHGFNPGTNFPKMASAQIVVASALADYPSNATTPYPRSPGLHAHKVFGALGAKVYVTAWHGNVQVVSDGETVTASVQRESEPWPELPKAEKK